MKVLFKFNRYFLIQIIKFLIANKSRKTLSQNVPSIDGFVSYKNDSVALIDKCFVNIDDSVITKNDIEIVNEPGAKKEEKTSIQHSESELDLINFNFDNAGRIFFQYSSIFLFSILLKIL